MTSHRDDEPAWDDPAWKIESDTAWQAGLRWLQCWWRANRLELPAGPHSKKDGSRIVGSTLPFDAPDDANFLSSEAAEAAKTRLVIGGGGLVSEDRLRRNLLSSQPMCFNLFGHFQSTPDAMLPWVRHLDRDAVGVERIEVEWAPPATEHFGGGSAFDAFVEYRRSDATLGCLGVECKYHENLSASDVPEVRSTYIDYTRASPNWREGAELRLDRRGLRQFWLNTLLADSLLAKDDRYATGSCVITACAADRSAREAFLAVRAEVRRPDLLRWQPREAILASIDGGSDWRRRFIERYLDFEPVRHLLDSSDPRLVAPPTSSTALAVAERVLGDGSIIEQFEDAEHEDHHLIGSRLQTVVEDLKQLRSDAAGAMEITDD